MVITPSFVFTFLSLCTYLNFNGKHIDGIETGYRQDDRGSILGRGGIFLYITESRPALELTQPPIQCVPGIFPRGVNWLEDEADHSPLSSAEVKKTWIFTSTPPYVFMA
jgi:hypothetical protein